ncbi:hypothetical protein FHS14_001483 [Paenibacillus baekrokdamisoli]|uniref:hypothetical protein n=1 Tax=Paenibacillus baekrokdamisoli TaxID=1712516 RepID=UPI000F7A8C4C|nr:hypothetical protein [Paenibacillus baekrokdamisoli]MBB3068507.1 hypothetical protein [Paenibacillus baekrokdamisoli]
MGFSLLTGCQSSNNVRVDNPTVQNDNTTPTSALTKPNADLKQAVEAKATLREHVATAFQYLDNGDRMDNPDEFLEYVMGKLQTFLSLDESMQLNNDAFSKISKGIQIIEVPNGRFFSYRGQPIVFGDSAPSSYSLLQTFSGDHLLVFKIFTADTRQLLNAQVLGNNQFIVSGMDVERPRKAFFDVVSINKGKLTIEPGLAPYNDGTWNIESTSDLISRMDNELIETYATKVEKNNTIVSSSDQKELTLRWNEQMKKLEVLKK